MHILLRKYRGRFTALFGGHGMPAGTPTAAASPLAALSTALLSPLALVFSIIAIGLAFVLATKGFAGVVALATIKTSASLATGLVTAKAIREERATLANEAQAILDEASKRPADQRSLTTEEQQKFDRIHAAIEEKRAEVERLEKHERVMAEMQESRGVLAGRQDSDPKEQRTKVEQEKVDQAFSAYLRNGVEGLDAEQRSIMANRFQREDRAQTVSTTGGGYLIPQGFEAQLEESMLAYGGVEQACDVFKTESGNSLPWPTVDDTAQTGALLAINTQVATQDVTYGQVSFGAYKFSSKLVLVPVELLQDAAFNLDQHLASVLGTRLGRVHNTYQTTGTGSSQPQGIVTGSSNGVTAAGTSTITYDELMALEHSVDPAYRNPAFGAGFMFNDGTLLKIKQIKDGNGHPLWQAGLSVGAPDRIDGFPYIINQDMAAMTTGLKPILFGALKKFKIRKVKGFTLVRLVERYADYHQIGFLAFTRFDSKMLDSGTDPCKYITMA